MDFSVDIVFDYIITFVSLSEVSLENVNHGEGKQKGAMDPWQLNMMMTVGITQAYKLPKGQLQPRGSRGGRGRPASNQVPIPYLESLLTEFKSRDSFE